MSPFSTDFNNPWPEIALASNDKGMAIKQYCLSLHILYTGQGSNQLDKVRISEVQLYKARKSPQHEYVSAKVCITDSPSDSDSDPKYVLFERFKGGKDKPSLSPFSTSRSKSCPDDLDSQKSSTASFANDRVHTRSRPYHNEQDEVHRMLTFDPALRLYELALLAFTIHESNGMYTALKANCYFYAGVLMNVLRDHFRWRELHVAGSEAVEQANIQLRKKLSKDKAGTVCAGINLAGNSDETAGIMVRYEETTKDFFKAIEANEAIAKAKQERFDQEMRRTEGLRMANSASKSEVVVRNTEEEAQATFTLRVVYPALRAPQS